MTDKTPEARPGSLDVLYDASITWRYLAPAGVTIEMCLEPTYWAQCIRELGQQRILGRHAWNRIEILAEDGSWEAELRVVSIQPDRVSTRLLRYLDAERAAKSPPGYEITHVPGNGWRVLNSAGAIIAEKLTSEDEAVRFATQHASPPKRGKGD